MNNNNDGNVGTGTGGISILAIFVVLCLTTLAALSLVSAQADHALAERTVNTSLEYYEADASAEDRVAEIVNTAQASAGWRDELEAKGYTVRETDAADAVIVGFTETMGDIKELKVEITVILDGEGQPTGQWERTCWQVQVTGEAGEPESLPLYQEN